MSVARMAIELGSGAGVSDVPGVVLLQHGWFGVSFVGVPGVLPFAGVPAVSVPGVGVPGVEPPGVVSGVPGEVFAKTTVPGLVPLAPPGK